MKYLPNYIKSRVERNQNFVMLFVGQTGTGKSYAAMSLGEALDPNFDITRVVFSADEFIRILNDDSTLTRGSVIIWDEAGVGMPAREWYSLSNKVISYVVQTFRVKGYILIMTTPSLRYIDSQIRSLFHGITETIDPSMYDGNFGWAKYMHLVHDPKEGKTIPQYPVLMDEHNRPMKLKGRTAHHGNTMFPKPSEELISDYEEKKAEFTDELIRSASDMMAGKEGREEGRMQMTVDRIMDIVLDDPEKWGAEYIDNKTTWQDHVYAVFKREMPEADVKKSDITASLHLIRHQIKKGEMVMEEFVRSSEDRRERPRNGRAPRFQEGDVDRIYDMILNRGFNQTARDLKASKRTLYDFRKKMMESGKWPEPSPGAMT